MKLAELESVSAPLTGALPVLGLLGARPCPTPTAIVAVVGTDRTGRWMAASRHPADREAGRERITG